jgi:hypothetical protein
MTLSRSIVKYFIGDMALHRRSLPECRQDLSGCLLYKLRETQLLPAEYERSRPASARPTQSSIRSVRLSQLEAVMYASEMRTQVALGYAGPAVDSGHMDVYEASANMIAFSEFVVAAAKATYGESVVANAQVAGFAKGSFVTDLVFDLSGMTATVFSVVPAKDLIGSPKALIETIRGAIDLWRHLKGHAPKNVVHDSHHVSVENNNGSILIVSTPSLNLVFNGRATEAAEQFIGRALQRDGIDAVEINTRVTCIIDNDIDRTWHCGCAEFQLRCARFG